MTNHQRAEFNSLFAAAKEVMREIAAEANKAREEREARKPSPPLSCLPDPAPVYAPATSCQCMFVRMPPCRWCEGGGDDA